MKKFVIAGSLVTALAVGATAFAQATPPAGQQPAADATKKQAPAKKAAPKSDAPKRAASASAENPPHTAPKQQPNTTGEANAADTALALGSVAIPKGVKADGKDLPAGMYQVRLTPDEAKPDAKGATEKLERWVEFRKGSTIVGKEVVSIVPADEAKLVQKDAPPPAGGSKVQTLKGGDYVRVWINKGGTYYLVHLAKS
jgi:hypothetical protein